MKILITDFVGSNLTSYLKDSHTIYGFDIVSPKKGMDLKIFSWNILYNVMLPEFDAIIHLAGNAHDTKNKSAANSKQ